MRRIRIRQPSYASVVATIALFVALGGGAYALGLKKNAVKSKNIAPGAVKTADIAKKAVKGAKIAPNAVTGAKVAADSLGGAQINEASLGSVPNADLLDGIDSAALIRGSGRHYTTLLVDPEGGGTQSIPLDIGGTLELECRSPASAPSDFTFRNGTGVIADVWIDKLSEGFGSQVSMQYTALGPGGGTSSSVSGPLVSSGRTLSRFTISASGRLTSIVARLVNSGGSCRAPVEITELRP